MGIERLLPPDHDQPREGAARAQGYVGRVLRAPATAAERLLVTVESYDPERVFEARWTPRAGEELPVAGAECLVLLDENGDAWAPVLEPGAPLP
jgi:hypothetical protein